MLRDDDVRDEKLTNDNEGMGNSYDFGARILDPRVGRWLSLDPLASKFPWSSPYVAMGNNPVIMVDPDGDWYWVANNNQTLFNYIMKNNSTQTVIRTMDKNTLDENVKKLNSLVDVWSNPKSPHYAPKIAEFVKNENNRIPVLVGTIGDKSVGGYCVLWELQGMKNPIVIKDDLDAGTVIHETIHHIYGSSEFDAYSGMMAAGYGDNDFKNTVTYLWDMYKYGEETNRDYIVTRDRLIQDLINSAPKDLNIQQYFGKVEGQTVITNYDGLKKSMIIFGKIIIGSDNKKQIPKVD
ncbi:MAG TPA: RHS repeat-associated core domain-containing protein [Candidatus Kapabacteria bacterium]|nr:RHS repeat-associated core domain-containing protein [Candidatus Kapabacteria bacterium]